MFISAEGSCCAVRKHSQKEAWLTLFLSRGNGACFTSLTLPPPHVALARCLTFPCKRRLCCWAASSGAASQSSKASASSAPAHWSQEDLRGRSSAGADDTAPLKSSSCQYVLTKYLWHIYCVDLRALTSFAGMLGLLLHSTEIHDLHFLNAMKGTFKVLISISAEFNSEGIGACSG